MSTQVRLGLLSCSSRVWLLYPVLESRTLGCPLAAATSSVPRPRGSALRRGEPELPSRLV